MDAAISYMQQTVETHLRSIAEFLECFLIALQNNLSSNVLNCKLQLVSFRRTFYLMVAMSVALLEKVTSCLGAIASPSMKWE